jgi:hypothetical protein
METKIIFYGTPINLGFPIIAENKVNKIIVLFTSHNIGTLLFSTNHPTEIGDYNDDWISVLDTNVWTILNEVTINFKS